jgi:hypothetical protein
MIFVVLALLYSTVVFAQGTPPTVGDKPLVQVTPKAKTASGKPQSIAGKLQACLDIDDGTKGRLDCYDAVISPKPPSKSQAKAAKPNGVMDCRFIKEEDERLTCFNGFAESIPKLPR